MLGKLNIKVISRIVIAALIGVLVGITIFSGKMFVEYYYKYKGAKEVCPSITIMIGIPRRSNNDEGQEGIPIFPPKENEYHASQEETEEAALVF